MALDRNYFNNIELEPLRRKYYDVRAVDALLVDIRSKAEMMNRETETLQEKLSQAEAMITELRADNEDLFKKGEALSQEVTALRTDLKEARALITESFDNCTLEPEPEEKNAPAEEAKTSDKILQEAGASRARAMQMLENLFERTKEMQSGILEQLDDQWEAFLNGVKNSREAVPEDLGSKVESIAKELREIEEDNDGT